MAASTPEHVRQGLAMGAAGGISGSAVVRVVGERGTDPDGVERALANFVAEMKGATWAGRPLPSLGFLQAA